jgi:hypothetical protein
MPRYMSPIQSFILPGVLRNTKGYLYLFSSCWKFREERWIQLGKAGNSRKLPGVVTKNNDPCLTIYAELHFNIVEPFVGQLKRKHAAFDQLILLFYQTTVTTVA